jgi:hypothetical protein
MSTQPINPPSGRAARVPIDRIWRDASLWPRFALDHQRVAEFCDIYADAEADECVLPRIELVHDDADGFLVADGHHRLAALTELGAENVPALIVSPPTGRDPRGWVYERGLVTAATAAKPLTRLERRAAVDRLLAERGGLSDREIARMVGVSHQTVGRARRRSNEPLTGEEAGAEGTWRPSPTADDLARRLVRGVAGMWESRPLGDSIFGDRAGKRLAHALDEQFADDALEWARRFERWARVAVHELSKGGA